MNNDKYYLDQYGIQSLIKEIAKSKNTGDPVASRQYLFSWMKQTDGSYKLGFQRTRTGVSATERAYLSLTGEAMGATTLNPEDDKHYTRINLSFER